ncbi:hypothetical protein ACF1GW_35645 [Streptomyces achromogenes]|uniref:hypothetical protein n=1 Tax=Streptomyces achromogenes TaxID=67255 RepID=UPI0036F68B36
MTDDLTRRFIERQLQLATDELVRTADSLAVTARQYADAVAAGRHTGAHRLAQDASLLALLEHKLTGMRDIATLVSPTEQTPA